MTAAGAGVALVLGLWPAGPCGACKCAPPPAERRPLTLAKLERVEADSRLTKVAKPYATVPESWREGCAVQVLPFYGRDLSFRCGDAGPATAQQALGVETEGIILHRVGEEAP
jgi:hypothetical protein